MVGDRTATREIAIRRRNSNLQFIADTHRSYDALQNPLIFWKGQDGYCINIIQRYPATGAQTNNNVSSKDYYAYRLMIRRLVMKKLMKNVIEAIILNGKF